MADSSTLVDRVKIFIESSGSGPFELGNAVPAFRGAEALTDGLTYSYAVESGADYEAGQGIYVLATNQLLRSPTISSSNGAPVPFPANVTVAFTALAADLTASREGTGTVTSVSGSGGTTGLTLIGGPIEVSGTLTLGGVLNVENGGTGGTTTAEAREGLGLGNVDNTSDADKPISDATATALSERVTRTELAASTGADLVGLPNGTVADAIKFITAAMAGIPDDGSEATDVTAELTALASAAGALNLPIQLGPRTYLTNGTTISFTTSVRGAAGTVIKSSATTAEQHVAIVAGDGTTFESVGIDGNCSADPSPWNSGNYDSFTGNRGLKVTGSNVTVRDVAAENVRWAGILVEEGCENVTVENCTTNRSRGTFGDGFIAMGASRVSFKNCKAYDFTRIGFVSDAYGSSPGTYCSQISYENCHAEYGHDASSNYGGGEFNGGFWSEKSGEVSWLNCRSKDTANRGFVGTVGEIIDEIERGQFAATNCAATEVETGFVMEGLAGYPILAVLSNCRAEVTGDNGFSVSSRADDSTYMTNCSTILTGAGSNRCSVRIGLGSVFIDRFIENWAVLNTTLRDTTTNYYGSLSHFADAPTQAVVKDWKTYDPSNVLVGTVFKFLSAALTTLDLTIERTFVRGVITNVRNFITEDCVFERMGSLTATERIRVSGGKVMGGAATDVVILRGVTLEIAFESVIFDFSANSGYLYLYNTNSSAPYPKMYLRGCRFIKNYETSSPSYGVRVNGDGAVINTTNANHVVSTDSIFVNTGSTTSNALFQLDSGTDAASKIFGRGNLKSSTITNIVNGAKLGTASSFENWT